MAEAQSESRERPILLILEPDIIVRSEISEYLRDCGFRVIEAATGDEAMTVLGVSDISVDVLLADASAPGTPDGFGVARWVRANRTEINAVLTGTPEKATKEAGELCDDGPTLSKPYDPQIVLDRIKRLMATRDRRETGGAGGR